MVGNISCTEKDSLRSVNEFQRNIGFFQSLLNVAVRNIVLGDKQSDRPIKRSRIDINVPELCRNHFRDRAFSCSGRPVYSNIDTFHYLLL